MNTPRDASDELAVGDMNGPLAYWGPVTRPGGTTRGQVGVSPAALGVALMLLRTTLHGRTWSGTDHQLGSLVVEG